MYIDFCTMNSVGNIISLATELNGLKIEDWIEPICEEVVQSVQDNSGIGCSENTEEKLKFLTGILEHNAGASKGSTARSNSMVKICYLVLPQYMSDNEYSSQTVLRFSACALMHFDENEKAEYCAHIKTLLTSILEAGSEGEFTNQLPKVVNLVEGFLALTDGSSVLSLVQKSMLEFLCDTMILTTYTSFTHSFFWRISGLIATNLAKCDSTEFYTRIHKKLQNALMEKGDRCLKSKLLEDSTDIQHCLILIDLLLDLERPGDESVILGHATLWTVLQNGLYSGKPAVRKQALYAIRKALLLAGNCKKVIAWLHDAGNDDLTSVPIFQWDETSKASADAFWGDFLLIAETLEENQLHVISPVLKRFENLVLMSKTDTGDQAFHSSWVCALFRRMISHESKAIIREGVMMSLKLDATMFPFLQDKFGEKFLFDSSENGLIPALQDVNLFCDFKDNNIPATSDPELPVVALNLEQFLKKCVSAHPDRTSFLKFLLHAVLKVNWSAVPLHYFCRALSSLPDTTSWTTSEMNTFQSLLARNLRTHNLHLRHAIQNLLVKSMMKFTNCSETNLNNILNIITVLCNVKGFFNNFKTLWNEISLWIFDHFDEFQKVKYDGADISTFTLKMVEEYCVGQSKLENSWYDVFMKDSQLVAVFIMIVQQAMATKEGYAQADLLKQILQWLDETTSRASTHLYMPKEKIRKSFSLICNLATMWSEFANVTAWDGQALYNDLFKILRNILSYTIMQFTSGNATMEDAKLLLDTWRKLFVHLRHLKPENSWPQQLLLQASPIVSVSVSFYTSVWKAEGIKNEQELSALLKSVYCLNWTCNIFNDYSLTLDQNLSQYIGEFLSSLDLKAELCMLKSSGNFDGKLVERYSSFIWSCVPYALYLQAKIVGNEVLNARLGLEEFLNQLDKVTEHNLPIYFNALHALIREGLLNNPGEVESLISDCINVGWTSVKTLAHSPSFWKCYRSFINAVVQKSTLSLPQSSPVQEALSDLFEKITLQSAVKPGLLCYTASTCVKSWMRCDRHRNSQRILVCDNCSVNVDFLYMHQDFVVQCLTFCHISKKEDLALQNALKLSDASVQLMEDSTVSPDFVNMYTIAMILQLNPKSEEHCNFIMSLVKSLLNLDDELTKKKSRYHHNSVHHHVKNKIFQPIVLLLDFLTEEDSQSVLEYLVKALTHDAQPSVRYFMEWVTALIINRFPGYLDSVLALLTDGDMREDSGGGGAKFSAICSYLSVVLLAGFCKGKDDQKAYFFKLVNICIPWCMSQHFSIRLYALAVLLRIKIYFENIGKLHELEQAHPALSNCLLFANKATGNVGKNWIKMQDNFFLFDFNPMQDLSIESVYISLPRLCCIPSSLASENLSSLVSKVENFTFKSRIRLVNIRDNLRLRQLSKWIPQESNKNSDFVVTQDERYRKNYGAENEAGDFSLSSGGNIQKKIMPWLEMADAVAKEKKPRPQGLILVASLIDKASNLGGLTRTCEIFGAEALVVQSLSCTNDKLYQSLAVTAHKWLPMMEVKPWQLEEYLANMRKEGYTLIGTEQTAQSVCLSKYRFPKKCVVVLGNEKEGIPLSILKILDVCVQIPQKGIVRSLNVHVSGAITVWEYARQHLDHTNDNVEVVTHN